MGRRDSAECNCKNLLVGQETWDFILNSAFSDDSVGAESFAHLLFTIMKAVSSGKRGRSKAINTLKRGIEQAYLYTEEHKAARELYMHYLTGRLMPWDEPRHLIKRAIERFKTKSEDPSQPQQKVAGGGKRADRIR